MKIQAEAIDITHGEYGYRKKILKTVSLTNDLVVDPDAGLICILNQKMMILFIIPTNGINIKIYNGEHLEGCYREESY